MINILDAHRKAMKKYNASEKGKQAQKKYWSSEKGKQTRKKYKTSIQGKQTIKAHYVSRRKWLNKLKNSPCLDCKNSFPPECMDFDHTRGKKLFEVTAVAKRAKENILLEIEKCDLVCANCHRIRTHRRQQNNE